MWNYTDGTNANNTSRAIYFGVGEDPIHGVNMPTMMMENGIISIGHAPSSPVTKSVLNIQSDYAIGVAKPGISIFDYFTNAEQAYMGTIFGDLSLSALTATGKLMLATNNSTRMTITPDGNVGIGTGSPNAPLQFSNALDNRKVVLYDINNDNQRYYGFGVNNGVLRYQLDGTGSDHVFYAGTSSSTSNELFRIKGNGGAMLAGTLTQSSDERLKTNIHPLTSALKNIQQLNGYTYNWKDKSRDNGLQ